MPAVAIVADSIEQSQRLGFAAIRLMYAIASELLRAGVGAIIESNFSPGLADGDLAPLIEQGRAVSLYCQAHAELCLKRCTERARSPERHAAHFDRERLAMATPEALAPTWRRYGPLNLPVPSLSVDTSDGYEPSLEALVAWVR